MSDRVKDTTLRASSKGLSAADKYRKLQKEVSVSRGSLTWNDCPAEELLGLIAGATEDGAAVLLAKTSDGGALVLRLIADKESVPFYAPDMAALNHLLEEVGEFFKTA